MAPARELPSDVRARMLADAVKLAKAAHYTNAGTVEFLLDTKTGSYYFMEVNPRIQVSAAAVCAAREAACEHLMVKVVYSHA
jgi:pyruvate carboxylase